MADQINKKSKEYHLINKFCHEIKNSSDQNIKETYRDRKLIYLDDDMDSLRAFVDIIEKLAGSSFDEAPNHLKGDLRDLSDKEIKSILGNHNVLLYGRSGMRINSKELSKYDN